MKPWWLPGELLGLPEMPKEDSTLCKWRNSGRITGRKRQFGKGYEYNFNSLPSGTQSHLRIVYGEPEPIADDHLRESAPMIVTPPADVPVPAEVMVSLREANQLAVKCPSNTRRPRSSEDERRRAKVEGAAKFSALAIDSPKRARAKAREWLILTVGELRRSRTEIKITQEAAMAEICRRVNAGEMALPEWVVPCIPQRHGVRSLSPDSLYRWTLAYAEQGLWGLTDGWGNRHGHGVIDPEGNPAVYRALLGRMLNDPQAGGRDIHAWLQTVDGIEVPALRTVQRFRERWISDNRALWTLLTHPGKWKNHYQVAFGSQHEQVVRLNQVWELDSTPGDWLLTDGRHTVVGCIDLWSRRFKARVSKTSSSWAVGQTFRAAALDWGLPDEKVRTDNGKDYTSEYFSQVLRELEIPQELCIPFASEQKGTIERMLKTLCYGLAKLLPGYIGHNVAEREAIRARETFAKRIMTPGEVVEVSMAAADLQSALDRWVEHVYHQDPHHGEGMDGLSPLAKAASWPHPVRRVDVHALDALLCPLAGTPTIGKKGIRWQHRFYVNAVLAEFIGETVLCRYDEADLGRLYVYRNDAFLCLAVDPAMTGISRAEVAAAAHHKQKQAIARHTKELREIKRETQENAAEAVLRHRAEQSGKLIAFPHQSEAHSTPGLEAGAAAVAARQPPVHVPTAAQAAAHARVVADLSGGQVVTLPTTAKQRYLRWVQIQRDMIQGLKGRHSAADLEWWDRYAETSEYRAQRRLSEDFPADYGLVGESATAD